MGSRRMTQADNNYGLGGGQSNSQAVLNDQQRHLREIQNPSNVEIPDSKAYLTESRRIALGLQNNLGTRNARTDANSRSALLGGNQQQWTKGNEVEPTQSRRAIGHTEMRITSNQRSDPPNASPMI